LLPSDSETKKLLNVEKTVKLVNPELPTSVSNVKLTESMPQNVIVNQNTMKPKDNVDLVTKNVNYVKTALIVLNVLVTELKFQNVSAQVTPWILVKTNVHHVQMHVPPVKTTDNVKLVNQKEKMHQNVNVSNTISNTKSKELCFVKSVTSDVENVKKFSIIVLLVFPEEEKLQNVNVHMVIWILVEKTTTIIIILEMLKEKDVKKPNVLNVLTLVKLALVQLTDVLNVPPEE